MFNVHKTMFLQTFAVASLSVAAFGQTSTTTGAMHPFPEGEDIPGSSSTLVRTANGITGTAHTSGLQPGAAYTFWWIIFNHPENCSDGVCGVDDVVPFPGNADAGVSLVYGGGHIIGGNGKSNFAAHLSVGDTSAADFGPGLLDPWKAEVHIVLRSHGQPIPGMIDIQIGSFGGGCDVNTCSNDQSVAHAPAADATSQRLDQLDADLADLSSDMRGLNGLIRALASQLGLGRLQPVE